MMSVIPLALLLLWWYRLWTMNLKYAFKLPRDPRQLSLGYVLTFDPASEDYTLVYRYPISGGYTLIY